MFKKTALAVMVATFVMPATAFAGTAEITPNSINTTIEAPETPSTGSMTIAGAAILQVVAVGDFSAEERIKTIWLLTAHSLIMPTPAGPNPTSLFIQPYNTEHDVSAVAQAGRSALFLHGNPIALATQGDADLLNVPVEAVAGLWANNLKVGLKALNATGKTPFKQALAKIKISVDGRNLNTDSPVATAQRL